MIKRIIGIALLGAVLFGNTGCNNSGGFKKTHGIEYKIVKEGHGKKASMGDIIQFNFVAKVDTTEIGDTYKQGHPGGGRVDTVRRSGDLQAVFPYLATGDSAIVRISCDTILKTVPQDAMGKLPPWMKKGKFIVVNMKVVSVQTMDEYKNEMQAKQQEMMKKMQEDAAKQMPVDDKILQDYFAKNNIKAEKTASGLYYTINKPGSGEKAKPGQMVSMYYIGKTLEGKQFDANVDENFKPLKDRQIFTFPLGAGQVIKGWDEGVQLLNKGAKATFYIPSPLAYGPQGAGADVPPNAILVFNVEVVDIKAGNAGAGAPQAQAAPAQ